jgi:hypothetical protein
MERDLGLFCQGGRQARAGHEDGFELHRLGLGRADAGKLRIIGLGRLFAIRFPSFRARAAQRQSGEKEQPQQDRSGTSARHIASLPVVGHAAPMCPSHTPIANTSAPPITTCTMVLASAPPMHR